jgi:hypothetical protein
MNDNQVITQLLAADSYAPAINNHITVTAVAAAHQPLALRLVSTDV